MRDIPRTIAAISRGRELAQLLRDGLPAAAIQVRPIAPDAAATELEQIGKAIFALASDTPSVASTIQAFCRRRPALVFWLGDPPQDLPRHARPSPTWRALLKDVSGALEREVAGMSLDAQYGVRLPGGGFTDSSALEVLIGAYPDPVEVDWSATTHLNRLLRRHAVGCRVDRSGLSSQLVVTAA